ncbi:MAG: hypothetical protein LBV71_16070 [Prevotella sp.]|jgi:hypothetical protein|nr:hypothetical protein [Prevotella sp.]
MNNKVKTILKAISEDIEVLAQIIFETDTISNNTKVSKNTLKDSQLSKDVEVKIQELGNPIIDIMFNHYIVYLEWDRPPMYGKMPPISDLRDWAIKNDIPDDNSTLYLISRAIWRDGHKGRPITKNLMIEIEDRFDKEWFDLLFEGIIDDLIQIFNE